MRLPLTGQCLCGAVQYQINDVPKKMGICHCRACQRFTGSGYWPFLVVSADDLKVTGHVSEYQGIGSSGKKIYRLFCTQCGSSLFGRPDLWPDIRIVSASSLDDPAQFKPEFTVWTEEAQPWDCVNPKVQQFLRNPA